MSQTEVEIEMNYKMNNKQTKTSKQAQANNPSATSVTPSTYSTKVLM